MRTSHAVLLSSALAAAALAAVAVVWPRILSSQTYPGPYQQSSSQASEFAAINRKLDQIIALENQILSGVNKMRPQLERTWENTRSRR